MQVNLQYRITLLAPLHIGSGFGVAGVINSALVRNHADFVYIPGSSLKGRLRSNALRLSRQLKYGHNLIDSIFGTPQNKGSLRFSDAHFDDLITSLPGLKSYQASTITGVGIERRRRISQEQHLFTKEHAVEGLEFVANIGGTLENVSSGYPKGLGLLIASLVFTDHLGGGKSRGFGKVRITIEQFVLDGTSQDLQDFLNIL